MNVDFIIKQGCLNTGFANSNFYDLWQAAQSVLNFPVTGVKKKK